MDANEKAEATYHAPVEHNSGMIPNSDGWFACSCGVVWWPKNDQKHPQVERAKVVLFKDTGKYYTEEFWRVPPFSIGPYDMQQSPDFRRIGGTGAVLVPTQEPWGYPHLFNPTIIEES